jgi:hypothetical protein
VTKCLKKYELLPYRKLFSSEKIGLTVGKFLLRIVCPPFMFFDLCVGVFTIIEPVYRYTYRRFLLNLFKLALKEDPF